VRNIAIISLIFLNGCVSLQRHAESARFSLSAVDSLKLGEQKMDDVLTILGTPSEKFDLSKVPQAQKAGIVWQYNEADFSRISVFFEAGIVKSVTWKVRDGDPEQNVEVVKKRYPEKWRVSVMPPSTVHSQPEICRLTGVTSGLSVDVRAPIRQVTSITRSLSHSSTEASFETWQADICGFLK
jgi:hypothetical protein